MPQGRGEEFDSLLRETRGDKGISAGTFPAQICNLEKHCDCSVEGRLAEYDWFRVRALFATVFFFF